jgi:hypothetical protein
MAADGSRGGWDSPWDNKRVIQSLDHPFRQVKPGAPEGIRTPNLLIRSQMLYPLSYGRVR